MKYKIKILLPLLFSIYFLKAQIHPVPGSKLNYTQVMFEYNKVKGANEYILQIAGDRGEENFSRLIAEQKDNSTATLITNLKFGNKYIWRYAGIIDGIQGSWNGPYRFEIVNDSSIDPDFFRCRVLKNDTLKNTGGLISFDYPKSIVDREGMPVWYLPLSNKLFTFPNIIRNLRITNAGTITFLTNDCAYDCDLNGNILWAAPNDGKVSNDTTEYYHHDFIRMENGNYMVLGEKYEWRNIPPGADTAKFRQENMKTTNSRIQVKIMFGTIIEYNKKGEVVWVWNSADYLSDKDLFSEETSTNTIRRNLPVNAELFGHLNAFDVDVAGEFIYAGFRDLSRVIKIKKSTGKVVYSWGAKMPSGEAKEGHDYFLNQHCVQIMPNNDIVVFNNNDLKNRENSSIVVEFSQPKGKQASKITWSFDCKFDSLSSGKSSRNGGALFLPPDNMLVCLGGVNRVFEVVKAKKQVVWDAFIEGKPGGTGVWQPLALYQAHNNSSLYPCYFTIQTNNENINVKASSVTIQIFNEGTNGDSYTVKAFVNRVNFNVVKSSAIPPSKSQSLSINLDKLPPAAKSFNVAVISNTNQNLVKRMTFNLSDSIR